MKLLLVLALITMFFPTEGQTAEPKAGKDVPESNARITPMLHPWDANSWETGSDHSFWRKTTDPGAAKSPTPTPSPVVSSVTPPAAKVKRPGKDFSNRQSEK